MGAYVIDQIEWHGQNAYERYVAAFRPLFARRHGGAVLAATEDHTGVPEGTWALPGTVIMRFPSSDHARAWMNGPEFPSVAGIRHAHADTNPVMVEGLD